MNHEDILAARRRKRAKAQGREVSTLELFIEAKRELEERIFKLESRVKSLEEMDRRRGLSGIIIGAR